MLYLQSPFARTLRQLPAAAAAAAIALSGDAGTWQRVCPPIFNCFAAIAGTPML